MVSLFEMSHDYMGFEDSLDEEDYGFILDREGRLKGIWIPKEMEDEQIPEAVVEIVKLFFDIDINDENNYGTIH